MDTELAVRIESEGGALTLTPMGLLEHFLPGATLMAGSSRVFEGHVPGDLNRKVYVQAEALYGMLMEAREKHLNPISSMYLIPSSHPDRPAGHKIKYDVGVQRARRIPGFLGMNMGLLVARGKEIKETSGELALDGDKVLGAWAEIYISGLPRPLRKEVSKAEFWGSSKVWSEKGGFMLCKVAVDHLLRLNYPTLYANLNESESEEDGRLIAAIRPEQGGDLGTVQTEPAPAEVVLPFVPAQDARLPFVPGERYVGTITTLTPRLPRPGKRDAAGVIKVETTQGELVCYFWSRPECLKKEELDWEQLQGQLAAMSFEEKTDRTGQIWRYVQNFELAIDAYADQQPEPEEEGV